MYNVIPTHQFKKDVKYYVKKKGLPIQIENLANPMAIV